MMAATADPIPVDARGRPIGLDVIKELLVNDVSLIRDAQLAIDADRDAVERGLRCYPNLLLRRALEHLEAAHDKHWEWYATATRS